MGPKPSTLYFLLHVSDSLKTICVSQRVLIPVRTYMGGVCPAQCKNKTLYSFQALRFCQWRLNPWHHSWQYFHVEAYWTDSKNLNLIIICRKELLLVWCNLFVRSSGCFLSLTLISHSTKNPLTLCLIPSSSLYNLWISSSYFLNWKKSVFLSQSVGISPFP